MLENISEFQASAIYYQHRTLSLNKRHVCCFCFFGDPLNLPPKVFTFEYEMHFVRSLIYLIAVN